MDRFLDIYDHPKLNHEDINHLNREIIKIRDEINQIETKKPYKELMTQKLVL
jgi:hypothetical protein